MRRGGRPGPGKVQRLTSEKSVPRWWRLCGRVALASAVSSTLAGLNSNKDDGHHYALATANAPGGFSTVSMDTRRDAIFQWPVSIGFLEKMPSFKNNLQFLEADQDGNYLASTQPLTVVTAH
jgi:hypothetical protein